MGKINLCIDIGNTSTKAGVFKQGEMIDYIKPLVVQTPNSNPARWTMK